MLVPQSPIHTFHPKWHDMSLDGKRRYLVESGQAVDWYAASSLLARHGHAVRARRKLRKAERASTPARQQKLVAEFVDSIEDVTVRPTCENPACRVVLWEQTQHADGRRETLPLVDHGRVGKQLFCLTCINAMVDAGEIERKAA